ncbi:putative peptidase M16 [Sterolibacterium denitrificans]|uniref:Peptidase M16 n=2 Tax=Sterolibacterium denitrificans TaxID=157592 RepID=A0A7Z7MU18_9PROT|nr:pitrilysin family protein [Sterolibacterium denitrificans]KYC29067.1 zinc protease [Sterolibacterium denitrificans]SMB21365.1 putative peptidase M16 [Sterolibacterium denitrificans]
MKKIFLEFLSAFAILLVMPVSAHAGIQIEHWAAPSGARVYFVASPALPILDVRIDFGAGSAFDPPGKAGLAALTSGLLDSGATLDGREYDEERIAEKLADLAASLGGSADIDRAGLSLRTLATLPERTAALALMRAMLTAPSFPAAALEREKTRAAAAIEEAETRPAAIAARRFQQALYPDHPYGAVPTVASIASITREDVVGYWRAHFGAPHAVISIIGAVTRAEAETIAAQLSDALPAATAAAELPAVALPAAATVKVPHPAMQSHIHIGLPAIKRGDADFFPLQVGNYILGGGGFVSRLMQEVREKRGYAYSVYSYFEPRKLEGPFGIGLQTKREQAGEAIKLVNATLDAFLKDGPTEKEMQAAKQNLIDGLALKLDSNAKILGHLATIGFYDLPLDYLDDYPRRIAAVTAAQVRAAFARHVQPEHLVTVIVAAD